MIRLWNKETGNPTDFIPVDAREALATDGWLTEDPSAVEQEPAQEPSLADKLEALTIPKLKDMAANMGLDIPSNTNKPEIIATILVAHETAEQRKAEAAASTEKKAPLDGGPPREGNED